MMPNDNIEVVRQHQMVVAWIRLRHVRKLKETKTKINLLHKNSNCSCSKSLVIIKVIKMILIIIVIIIIILSIMIITKCRGRSRTLITTNIELPVTIIQRPKAANITKSSISDAAWVLYTPLKLLIHHLTWWIGIDHATWIPCLELTPTWFLKNTCNSNINKHNCNNNSNNVITMLK